MLKSVVEKLTVHMLSKILLGLLALVAALAIWAHQGVILLATSLSPSVVALLLEIALALVLLLSALVFYLLPTFQYVQKYQFFQHRVTGLYYCPQCRAKNPLSPLKKEISGWRCPFCKDFYKDPDYIDPPPPKAKQSDRI
ncbi:MAG: hypothetical protein ACXV8Q_19085 [Methylobacter sp.]